jgi:multidrug transporter EmrE-like cation transporter
MQYLLLGLVVFACTAGGVTASLAARSGRAPVSVSLPFTLGTAGLWAWQTKHGTIPLLQASALFDVVASSTWLIGLSLFDNEPVTKMQVAGLVCIVGGMALLNLGGKS